jgi:dimethylaniline monooxygenase (N-oxide forming)
VSGSLAVIGAGPAGLATAAAALEAGLRPTVFERTGGIGGVWRAGGAAWPGMRTNLSRYTCCFSTLPWPAAAPDFPSRDDVLGYLRTYAEFFLSGADRRMHCAVTGIVRSARGWRVDWRESHGAEHPGRCGSTYFDAVAVASGFFSRPQAPVLPGLDRFAGQALHSSGYRGPAGLSGRRVVVVGTAFSGAEIAVELAEAGAEVAAVMARPMWILPRHVPQQSGRLVPLDLVAYRHQRDSAETAGPADSADSADPAGRAALANLEAHRRRTAFLSTIGTNPGELHPRLRLDPAGTGPNYTLVSDRLPQLVRSGSIAVAAARAVGLDRDSVLLDDGSRRGADAVVWCTGHLPDLPFLPDSVLRAVQYEPGDLMQPLILHQGTFHPDLPDLAFVGVYRGPFFGVIELQARWACAVFAGHLPPPDRAAAHAGLAAELRIRAARPRPQFPHGDYPVFADALAAELGLLPPGGPDPDHAWWWDAPLIPAHYRSFGPGAVPEQAAAAIKAAADRLNADRLNAP